MLAYIARRLLLVVPTLFGIMLANFIIVQAAPGGPVDLMLARLRGHAGEATARVASTGVGESGRAARGVGEEGATRASQGIDPDLVRQLEKQFGFDKPAWQRFVHMIRSYAVFDLGTSFYRDRPVLSLMLEKLPVSITLGLWTTLLVYLISIPLGVAKAVRDGTPFDVWTSAAVIVGYAIPGFLFAILLVVLFAGGSFAHWFPLRGLTSDTWAQLSWPQRILDYLWHIALPVTALVVGGFASLAMLTKNSFLDEINKQYVMLFAGELLIEVIFSLNGLGLLGFEAAVNRDYPVMFGTLYLYTLIGLLLNIVTDLTYTVVDPRIDFERRET
ncbi:MAG: microcin ABC transporter permease [Candidatus Rokuibacteriota bacterium]|nr:MAG: microcin ABC transporter permease [Candidatus Rokubacteria bacterium]